VSWCGDESRTRTDGGTHLAGDRVYEFAKRGPGRDLELHDVDADVVGGGPEIARGKGHGDDTLVVGDVEPERGVEAGGDLRGVRGGCWREEGTDDVGFAGVGGSKGDHVARDAPFAEEHAGEERANEGACGGVRGWSGRRGRADGRHPRDGGSGLSLRGRGDRRGGVRRGRAVRER